MIVAIIVAVIFIQESERRVPIQYSNQTSSAYGAKQNYIPFKLFQNSFYKLAMTRTMLKTK